jgi:hypothetical protein
MDSLRSDLILAINGGALVGVVAVELCRMDRGPNCAKNLKRVNMVP